jgi:N-acetylmuramoyl-L-alanine amidase
MYRTADSKLLHDMRKRTRPLAFRPLLFIMLAAVLAGCAQRQQVGQQVQRRGDEIMVAGRLFHTGAPVVLWTDPGGYDAYRTERRFAPWKSASFQETAQAVKDINSPARYGLREQVLSDEEIDIVRGGGWPLELLQEKVDQFVIHYDVCGTARQCFNILHDHRGLSVQFMLDTDGTIYQTCDVKERAFHATKSNPRSVGIEIANIGAYPPTDPKRTLDTWYRKDDSGSVRMVLPVFLARNSGIRTPNFVARPIRQERVQGEIHGHPYEQYDLTPQQYDSLIKLTAALCTALPRITCDYPRDAEGKLVTTNLSDEEWQSYTGVLGHFHVQRNKQDPGPAFQWDRVIDGARKLMSRQARSKNEAMRGQAVQFRPDRGTGAKPATTTQPTPIPAAEAAPAATPAG